MPKKPAIRLRNTAPAATGGSPAVKDVPAIQSPAGKSAALTRGGTTSGTPGQIVRYWNRWRENYNALTALTISLVRSLNEMTQRGDHAYPQWTYRTIERRHPVLKALIDCCEAPLENLKWDVRVKEVLPEGFTEADAEKQKDALKSAYGQIDNLREALKHLSHADFSGYAHCQKHRLDGAVVHLECLFTFCICRDGLFGDWYWNPDSRSMTAPEYVLTAANRIGSEQLPREDFVIREVERPINEIGLENFVRRKLIEKDWSAFDEIFGIPSGVVIMPSGIPPEKVQEYEQAARQISEGGSGAMPNGSDYKKNDMPHDGSALFKTHMEALDADLVLAGTGGKLKMLVEHAQGNSSGGSGNVRGSSRTQDDTFKTIAMARGNDVAQQFHRDFDQPFLAEKFPMQPALVEFCLITENEVDVTSLCTNVATLKQAGKNVSTEFVAAQSGYEFEEDDAAQPPTGAGSGDGPVFDPNKDIVTQRALWRESHKAGEEMPVALKNRFVTLRNGHVIFLEDDGETANLKEQNDTSQRSKALGQQGARERGNGIRTVREFGESASDVKTEQQADVAGGAAGQEQALEKLHADPSARIAHNPGHLIPGDTGEHLVEHDADSGRAIKHTKDGYGFSLQPNVMPFGADVGLRQATPAEYVGRLHAQNEVFGTDARIEGVSKAYSDKPSLVSSQKWIDGGSPTQPALEKHMSSIGFQKVSPDAVDNKNLNGSIDGVNKVWYHPKSGYVVADVKPDNFKQDAKGRIVPIDVIATHAPAGSDLHKAMLFGTTGKMHNRDSSAVYSPADHSSDLAETLHETLLPVLKRLQAIAAIDDAAIQQHMVEKLLKDFPQIAEAIQADDSLAKKLSPVLADALVAGLADNSKLKIQN